MWRTGAGWNQWAGPPRGRGRSSSRRYSGASTGMSWGWSSRPTRRDAMSRFGTVTGLATSPRCGSHHRGGRGTNTAPRARSTSLPVPEGGPEGDDRVEGLQVVSAETDGVGRLVLVEARHPARAGDGDDVLAAGDARPCVINDRFRSNSPPSSSSSGSPPRRHPPPRPTRRRRSRSPVRPPSRSSSASCSSGAD